MNINIATLQFLKDLKQNNQREWFVEQKNRFLEAQQNAKLFFAEIYGILQEHDEIEASKMMRIYRDVRFSNDKTPYKAQFANSFSRLGK